MQFTRRSVQTAAALAVVGSLLASPAFAQDKPKIALIMKSLANEFFRTMEDGAKAHQKAHAKEYTLVANGIKNETDTAAQIKMIEQAVAQKVSAIVLAPADSKALVPVVKAAIDKGIIVVNIDNQLDADALKEKNITVPFVGPDNRAGAKLVGDHLAKMLKTGANLLLLDEPTNDLDVDTLRALEEALLNFAGCAIVISHDRWFLDRIATHIMAFEGDSHVEWFEGNFQDYEADKKRRLGADADQPHRIKYKPLERR